MNPIKFAIFALIIFIALGAVLYDRFLLKPTIAIPKEQNIINIKNTEIAPDFTINGLEQEILSFNQISEKIILLNFWASWCLPCVTELPEMLELVNHFDGKLALFTISIDDDLNDVKQFLANIENHQRKHTYWAWDQNKKISLNLFNTMRVPETIIINQDRIMIHKIIGTTKWNSTEMHQLINNILNKSPI